MRIKNLLKTMNKVKRKQRISMIL